MSQRTGERVVPRELADWLLARGRHWVTTVEAADLLGIPHVQVSPTLARWIERGLLFSPTKGAYVPIPSQYRSWGAVPASEFIDPMMNYLGHPYYVCLLSAAEVHGYAHQRPQVFQVLTSARLRDRSFGRVHLSFVSSVSVEERDTVVRNTPTGVMRVSSLETTVMDLVSMPFRSGGLSNIATVISEMLDENVINAEALTRVAGPYPRAVQQRVGWMVEHLAKTAGFEYRLDALADVPDRGRLRPVLMDPARASSGEIDARWMVDMNVVVEPDE